jgi:hypothetical protein
MLTIFGSIAVTIMMVSYKLEPRSQWYVLLFALASMATAVYSGLVEAYPITVVEALWSLVALQRFVERRRGEGLVLRPGVTGGADGGEV